jgi:hydroxypyruvate isomerase
MKIAANLSMLFTELPLIERVAAAAKAGFDGVEIQFPYEISPVQLKRELDRYAMPLVLINLPAGDLMSGGLGLAAVSSRQAQFDVVLRDALLYAATARPLCVNVLPGRLAEGGARNAALGCLIGNLRKAAEAFQALDIKVVVEAINPVDMPGFLINTPQHLEEVVSLVGHANCLAQLDLYHMARQQLDIEAGIRLLVDRIGHVQFADCPGRGVPGSGEVDFMPLLKCLRDTGYQGWLGAEYKPEEQALDSMKWLRTWRREVDLLRG